MEDSDKNSGASSDGGARKSPARRRAAPKRKRAAPRKAAPRKKTAGRRRRTNSSRLPSLLQGWSARAGAAGGSLAAASAEGIDKARRALESVGSASRRTIDRMLKQWSAMDARKRAQFLGALLGALAAASAPIVRSRISKK